MNIVFSGLKKEDWLKVVASNFDVDCCVDGAEEVFVYLNDISRIEDIEPTHIVLLACLRQSLKDKGYNTCFLKTDNKNLSKFLFDDVNLGQYWIGNMPINYTESPQETVFNLWRIKDNEKESYSELVHSYLTKKFFKSKDLSSLKLSLLETFYNIFDHADAKGNAFSYMRYNVLNERLSVAICDLGKGIASNIRAFYPDVTTDEDAILKATIDKVTSESRVHNKGMGMGFIIDSLQRDDELRILSNRALLYVKNGNKDKYPLDFNFSGTLIYYDITLSNFEDLEIVSTFDFDF